MSAQTSALEAFCGLLLPFLRFLSKLIWQARLSNAACYHRYRRQRYQDILARRSVIKVEETVLVHERCPFPDERIDSHVQGFPLYLMLSRFERPSHPKYKTEYQASSDA
ncbi:hypothetical protein SISSUDRAFT_1083007 [Sistotremastrum suecicum HHB10207 ss-3]|uniref:Uncharacterized protein n=1 Tax=Sistotremastrum suecicum HHB10207 ss-3 TaxID=1314776 RepID=A0A165ZSY2_9AGAM|nr:hypothetical protein SISSUDRAFT_1083007 [Sistotremastrum suecicum HHB10207 ss-3]